jgi:sorbitol/mannitol transport system permease protein
MRSFLAEVPTATIEAAQLDGAGTFSILTRVVAPIAMPGVAATSPLSRTTQTTKS